MKAFAPYVSRLEELLVTSVNLPNSSGIRTKVDAALDGQPSIELRRSVSLDRLRASGAFFTGSGMAQQAIMAAMPKPGCDATVFDPACGAGDLLVGFVNHLQCSNDLSTTISHWGSRVLARDVQPEFVRATKLRLALAALRRQPRKVDFCFENFDDLFPQICVGSSLTDQEVYRSASYIVINPPFTSVNAPQGCVWGTGKVNSAAIFMDACAVNSEPGTVIVAILPDVLRSGARYEKWRKLFEQRVSLKRVQIVGRFDRFTDVDVFIAVGIVRAKSTNARRRDWTCARTRSQVSIKDKFKISVGAVVSYRNPHLGPWCPFVQARDLPSWTVVSTIAHHRRFSGKTVKPPFVVVRRTSRPDDKNRAVGTVVTGIGRVAVENHLLVLRPKDNTVRTCKLLLKRLHNSQTNKALNRRIRCRHLTVAALGDLPWAIR